MPYVCNECGKSFRYKVTQRTHKCFGKSDETTPNPKPLTNPLAEENASFHDQAQPLDQGNIEFKVWLCLDSNDLL